jgi:hypothetical protein
MEQEALRISIRGILNEYGCLHSGGKMWDEAIEDLRNEELIERLLMLHQNKTIRCRTVIYHWSHNNDVGMRFIEEYIPFRNDDNLTIDGVNYTVAYTDYNLDDGLLCVYVIEDD